MKKKKGFTLIELLAVIVILAIIALIAIPQVIKILNKAKKSAAEDSTYGIISSVEGYVANFLMKNYGSYPSGDVEFECVGGCSLTAATISDLSDYELTGLESLNFKGNKPKGGKVTVSNGGKDIIVENLLISNYKCNYNPPAGLEYVECVPSGETPVIPTKVSSVTASPITSISAQINVRVTGTITKYEYEIVENSQTPTGSYTEFTISNNNGNFTVSSLESNKTYRVYIRLNEDDSTINSSCTFTTKNLLEPEIAIVEPTGSGYSIFKKAQVTFTGTGDYFISPTVDTNSNGINYVVADADVIPCTITDNITVVCNDAGRITAGDSITAPLPTETAVWYKVVNKSNPKITFTADGSIKAHVTDGSSYKAVSAVNVVEIDGTGPTSADFTATPSGNTITVTATGVDSDSYVYGYQFKLDNGSWITQTQDDHLEHMEKYLFDNVDLGSGTSMDHTITVRVLNASHKKNPGETGTYTEVGPKTATVALTASDVIYKTQTDTDPQVTVKQALDDLYNQFIPDTNS